VNVVKSLIKATTIVQQEGLCGDSTPSRGVGLLPENTRRGEPIQVKVTTRRVGLQPKREEREPVRVCTRRPKVPQESGNANERRAGRVRYEFGFASSERA
jgi:hypothetical protein